jgi:hypothetical protein
VGSSPGLISNTSAPHSGHAPSGTVSPGSSGRVKGSKSWSFVTVLQLAHSPVSAFRIFIPFKKINPAANLRPIMEKVNHKMGGLILAILIDKKGPQVFTPGALGFSVLVF